VCAVRSTRSIVRRIPAPHAGFHQQQRGRPGDDTGSFRELADFILGVWRVQIWRPVHVVLTDHLAPQNQFVIHAVVALVLAHAGALRPCAKGSATNTASSSRATPAVISLVKSPSLRWCQEQGQCKERHGRDVIHHEVEQRGGVDDEALDHSATSAKTLGIDVHRVEFRGSTEIASVFAAMVERRDGAALVIANPLSFLIP